MPIAYDMPLYRPPSEGRNLIIQATLGCSFNRCTFCSMYADKTYKPLPLDEVCAQMDAAAKQYPGARRVFLADGDALALPTEHLVVLLESLTAKFEGLNRVTSYATPKNLLDKSPDELALLREKGLKMVYLGLESGANTILKRIIKGASQKTLIKAMERARDAGMKISATVILGLGGRGDWQTHIDGTAELINASPPNFLSTLQLMLEPQSYRLFMDNQPEDFVFQDDAGILAEQERLLTRLNPPRPVIFRSNHASNCLSLAGNLPRDKPRLLNEIKAARSGTNPIRPSFLRGL